MPTVTESPATENLTVMQLNAFSASFPFQVVGTLFEIGKCLNACGRLISLGIDDKQDCRAVLVIVKTLGLGVVINVLVPSGAGHPNSKLYDFLKPLVILGGDIVFVPPFFSPLILT